MSLLINRGRLTPMMVRLASAGTPPPGIGGHRHAVALPTGRFACA